MKQKKSPLLDRIWFRIKNNKYISVVIIVSAVVAGISSFSKNLINIFQTTDDLIPNGQTTDIIDSDDLIPSSTFENFFSANFEISDTDESDIINLSKDDISIDFSINNKEGDLKYTIKKEEERIIINPFNYYLSILKKGGPITPINYYYTPFEFQFPTLDFKITNNSDKTLFFTKAVFSVSRSRPDQFPIILIHKGYGMNFPITNIGWGKVFNCTLFFNLETSDSPTDFQKGFKNQLSLGNFEKYPKNTDLTSYFKALGVKTEIIQNGYISSSLGLGEGSYTIIDGTGKEKAISEKDYEERILDARGPFKDGSSKIFGEIHYEGINAAGKISKEKVQFEGIIVLGEPGVGMPAPPSFVYDLNLESNKDNYKREVPLSQAIKSNEFDRFNIRICAPQSSRHQCNLTLFYNDNRQFTIPNISLNYFMTKPDSSYITNDKSREREN
ncbi:MAG TPA: hypothetical protein VF868_07480 [Bacteroidia bacterium]|jgi:hypothetical protein